MNYIDAINILKIVNKYKHKIRPTIYERLVLEIKIYSDLPKGENNER